MLSLVGLRCAFGWVGRRGEASLTGELGGREELPGAANFEGGVEKERCGVPKTRRPRDVSAREKRDGLREKRIGVKDAQTRGAGRGGEKQFELRRGCGREGRSGAGVCRV